MSILQSASGRRRFAVIVLVSLILGYLAEGWTVDAVLAECPQLEVDDVRACVAYGAQLACVRFADLDAAG